MLLRKKSLKYLGIKGPDDISELTLKCFKNPTQIEIIDKANGAKCK